MSDAIRIAPILHGVRQPPAHTERVLLFPQQQPAAIGGLGTAVKINRDFLAANSTLRFGFLVMTGSRPLATCPYVGYGDLVPRQAVARALAIGSQADRARQGRVRRRKDQALIPVGEQERSFDVPGAER